MPNTNRFVLQHGDRGLVGANCINVDDNYLDEVARNDLEKREQFLG